MNQFLRRVKTNSFLKEFETSGSHPCLFECDDGKLYVTKHYGLGDRTKHLINELISALIANEIGLRIPNYSLIEINSNIFDIKDIFQGKKPKGLGFGSEYAALYPIKNFNDLNNLPPSSKVDDISVSEDFLKIILFDIWIRNNDRVINNPNIIVQEVHKEFRIFAIDHAATFAQLNYNRLGLEKNESPSVEDTLIHHPYFEKVKNNLDLFFEQEVDKILKLIENFATTKLNDIVSLVPKEWNLGNSDSENIVSFLDHRKGIVREQFFSLIKEAGY
jgi:hypothetical protein